LAYIARRFPVRLPLPWHPSFWVFWVKPVVPVLRRPPSFSISVRGRIQIQGQQGVIRVLWNTDSATHGPDFDDLGVTNSGSSPMTRSGKDLLGNHFQRFQDRTRGENNREKHLASPGDLTVELGQIIRDRARLKFDGSQIDRRLERYWCLEPRIGKRPASRQPSSK
jgi:hypothetical protein